MCRNITSYMVKNYVWTYIFKKFTWQFKTKTSATLFYNSNRLLDVLNNAIKNFNDASEMSRMRIHH